MRTAMLLAALAASFFVQEARSADAPDGRFETKLSPEQRARHVLHRMTFGARPGDLDQVRKLGVEKWVELQLHPERIAEDPRLEARLKPFESLRLDAGEVLRQYYPQFPPGQVRFTSLNDLLPQEQIRKVLNGTAEERHAAILALEPEKRWKVLAVVPPNVVEGLPDLQKEQTEARQKQIEERQMQMRQMRPPLSDLLDPPQIKIAMSGPDDARKALFASLEPEQLKKVAAVLSPTALAGYPELRRMATMSRAPQQAVLDDLREAKMLRALYSNRQLEEVLTDFWFNHFNVFEGKGQNRAMLAVYEREAIRPHVLGKFQDLLLATARHPAMLTYLDNWMSMSSEVFELGPFAPGPASPVPFLMRQAHGLNENYGRELLELHTMGADGGFTQSDVIAVARCFTGWTIRQPNRKPEFAFAVFMHDTGEKTVLGHKIATGGGEQDGLQVIDILVHHPATARYLSTKLARRFVADNPPASLVDRMARTFLKTGGDLRAVLETMFTSREFFSEGAWQAKIKSPLEVVAGAVRALDADALDTYQLAQRVADMGEPLYGKESPNGYKDAAEAWLSTANILARMGFADALANGKLAGTKVDSGRLEGKSVGEIARLLLNREPSEQMVAAIEKGLAGKQATPAVIAGLVLASPDFQRR